MMTEAKKIEQIRKKIDRIDAEIIALLSERVRLTGEIGTLKEQLNKPVVDEQRESELVEQLTDLAHQYNLDVSFISRLWHLILNESYRVQNASK